MPFEEIEEKFGEINYNGEKKKKKKKKNKKKKNKENITIGLNMSNDKKEIIENKEKENMNIALSKDENCNKKGHVDQTKENKAIEPPLKNLQDVKNNNNQAFEIGKEDDIFSQKDLSLEEKVNLLIKISNTQRMNLHYQETKLQSQEEKLLNQEEKLLSQEKELLFQKELLKNKDDKIEFLSEQIKGLKVESIKNAKVIRNYKQGMDDINHKVLKINNELRLIQSRDVFKNIVDLFCKALGIDTKRRYDYKIPILQKAIAKLKIIKQIKAQLIKFFEIVLFNLKNSNKNAHTLYLDQEILAQIFPIIDPKNELIDLKQSLENGRTNKLLHDLAVNRDINFEKKQILYDEEEKIIDTVKGIKDLIG